MTQNQINYAKLQEERRHNLATEGYTGIELEETRRHNTASEGISWYSAGEQGRHNVAQENINWYSAQNLADLQYWQGQQAQSQRYLNDVRGMIEEANYVLDKWYKEQQINIQSVDAATRDRAQRATEREINAKIEDTMRRLNIDESKLPYVINQINSEITKNYGNASQSAGNVAKAILDILKYVD